MSLKRLHEAVKSLIRQHVDEHGRFNRGGTVLSEKNQQQALLSRWSEIVKKAYEFSNFSATWVDDHHDTRAIEILHKMGCFQEFPEFVEVPTRVGMSDDSDICGKDFVGPLMQELNVATIHDLSQQDLQYLLKTIKKHYDAVTDEDMQYTFSRYNVVLQDKQSEEVEERAEDVFAQLQECCADGALIFADAFVNTLCSQYIKPLMIESGISRENAAWLTQGIKSTIATSLSNSIVHLDLGEEVALAIYDVLRNVGDDKRVSKDIAEKIKAVVTTSQDSYNLLQLGMDGVGAEAGQFAAYQVIHMLPKLTTSVPADAEDIEIDLPAAMRLRVMC